MASLNAIDPTPEQIKAFLSEGGENTPVFMLNLLKFKERATYRDGEDVSGEVAYRRYANAFGQMLKDLKIDGTKTVFGGKACQTLIGEADWDAVAIVRYPNAQTMFETVSSDAYRKIHYHRKAGLAGQLLINCDDSGLF